MVKTNGDYFFGSHPLCRERVTRMLGEQMLVTDELCKRIQDSPEREFQNFIRGMEAFQGGREAQPSDPKWSGLIPRLGSLSSLGRLTPATTHDSVRQKFSFDFCSEAPRTPRTFSAVLDPPAFQGFVPCRPHPSLPDVGSPFNPLTRLSPQEAGEPQRFPPHAAAQTKSPGPTANYPRFFGTPNN